MKASSIRWVLGAVSLVCVFEGAALASGAQLIRVPEDQLTLAAAVASAPDGATIRLAPGQWDAQDVTLSGRTLAIVGAGAELTTLSGAHGARVLHITDGSSVEVQDLAIREGFAPVGGGGAVLVDGARCVLRDCQLIANRGGSGGALFVSGPSEVAVIGCRFEGNSATEFPYGDGGAIFAAGGQVVVESSLFKDNSAPYHGGALSVFTSVRCHNSIFEGNGASYGGAARVNVGGNALTFSHCTFVDNHAAYGTAIFCYSANVRLINCALRGSGVLLDTTHGGQFHGAGTVASSGHLPGYSNTIADPQIAPDYSLLPTSPCIDSGVTQMLLAAQPAGEDLAGCTLVLTDYAGNPRWSDVLDHSNSSCHRARFAPDAGALEYAGVPSPAPLPIDINDDGALNGQDLAAVLAAWGLPDCSADINVDGVVDGKDLTMLLSRWATCHG
jgi:hypothetical protein